MGQGPLQKVFLSGVSSSTALASPGFQLPTGVFASSFYNWVTDQKESILAVEDTSPSCFRFVIHTGPLCLTEVGGWAGLTERTLLHQNLYIASDAPPECPF